MSKDEQAVLSADILLDALIRHQPALIEPDVLLADNGKDVGDFIAALRDRLIAMYEQAPR